MQTHRAYAGADSEITCWVRDAEGKRDLTAETLTVPVYAYGHSCALLALDATQPEVGKVVFTVTEDQTGRYFPVGLYRFAVKAGDELVYGGLLEVV